MYHYSLVPYKSPKKEEMSRFFFILFIIIFFFLALINEWKSSLAYFHQQNMNRQTKDNLFSMVLPSILLLHFSSMILFPL